MRAEPPPLRSCQPYTLGLPYGTVLQALGADFAPYIQYCVPRALESVAQDDGTWGLDDDDEDDSEEDEDEEDEEGDTDARRARQMSIRTGRWVGAPPGRRFAWCRKDGCGQVNNSLKGVQQARGAAVQPAKQGARGPGLEERGPRE